MAERYESFLVGNMRIGLEEGLSPWLLPQDAWSTMKNAYLRRGVLCKRGGYSEFARMVHSVSSEAVNDSRVWGTYTGVWGTDTTIWGQVSGTLAHFPIRPGDLTFTDGTITITDAGDGTFTGHGTGTIDYTTGAYTITLTTGITGSLVANYDYYPGLSITGIESYSNVITVESDLIVFDKRRAAEWDATNQKLEDICDADTWTGGDYDYFWGCNAQSKLYVTNNVDRVKYWDGTGPWTNLLMDIDGDGDNDVDTCLLLFFYKERIVALRTAENGTLYPQRARWSSSTDHGDWSEDNYVDAPTNDWIMTADFIGEDLIVWFENSCWRLKYTGDAGLPFRWEQISVTQGSYAVYSGFSYNDVMGVIGATEILETDNLKVYSIDSKIPDAVIGMNLSGFDKIYTIQIQELQQIVLSYPEVGETGNSASLCYNYEDKSWSRYDYGFNVYGFYKEDTEPTIDDIDETWDELEISWDDNSRQAGYPVTLGGTTTGYVHKINYGGDDNGTAIAFETFSGRWNPFLKEGKRARFGWVEFLVDRDPDISMTVDFYAHVDGVEALVASETVTFGGDEGTAEQLWVRADNGAIGDFHRIKLSSTASAETLKIHAVKIHMKRAGGMK